MDQTLCYSLGNNKVDELFNYINGHLSIFRYLFIYCNNTFTFQPFQVDRHGSGRVLHNSVLLRADWQREDPHSDGAALPGELAQSSIRDLCYIVPSGKGFNRRKNEQGGTMMY